MVIISPYKLLNADLCREQENTHTHEYINSDLTLESNIQIRATELPDSAWKRLDCCIHKTQKIRPVSY